MHEHGFSSDYVVQYDPEYTGQEVMGFLTQKIPVPPEAANKPLHP